MTFFDPYEIGAGASTPPRRAGSSSQEPEPSLNEEVSQVIGQLGRFWGGFRKQSQIALEAARKDIGEVVSQAQRELSKLAPEATASTSTVPTATDENEKLPVEPEPHDDAHEASAGPSTSASTSASTASPTSPIQTLFSRIQSSLPPNISSTLQNNLPSGLRDASGAGVDFAQLQATLTREFGRVQGVTRAQAEEYVHRSEVLLRDAGAFLKDAVKVVPPDGADAGAGVVWDGADFWVLPSPVGTPGWGAGGAREDDGGSRRAAGTRADALLRRLKHDPEMVKLDPHADESVQGMYEKWIADEIDSKEGGIEGDAWSETIRSVLDEKVDGAALTSMRDALVPSILDNQTFWTRYFFRVYQIQTEEEKRKALLSGATEGEDDFSWEDEDEETATSSLVQSAAPSMAETIIPDSEAGGALAAARPSTETVGVKDAVKSAASSQAPTPATTSPRDSSESSYDVISSGNASASAEWKTQSGNPRDEDQDDADSDWE